jgi:gas vesicle protein
MAKKQKKGAIAKQVIGVGVGVAALSAAAYLLFGPNGKKNRKIIRGWAVKMKGEIIEKFEEVKELTEPIYNEIIDEVQKKYAGFKNIDKKELQEIIAEMRKDWISIKKTANPKKAKKAVVSKKKKTTKK